MSRIDQASYVKFVREERNKRVHRNSSKPIIIPDSGIIPRFAAELNRGKQPQSISGLSKFQVKQFHRNIGAKPQGAQRFPQSVPKLGGKAKIPLSASGTGNGVRIGYVPNNRMRS